MYTYSYVFIHSSTYLSIHASIYLFIHLFVHLFIHPCFFRFIYLRIYIYIYWFFAGFKGIHDFTKLRRSAPSHPPTRSLLHNFLRVLLSHLRDLGDIGFCKGWSDNEGNPGNPLPLLKHVERCWKMLKDVEKCWKMLKDVEKCSTSAGAQVLPRRSIQILDLFILLLPDVGIGLHLHV